MWADRAEALEAHHGKLALGVLKPESNTAAAMRSLRDRIVRAKLAPAGIWSIETGELYAGLHLNILAPAQITHSLKKQGADIELVRTSARAAGAYITKRTGAPCEQQYTGKLAGSWGTISQIIMAAQTPDGTAPRAALFNWALMSPSEKAELAAGWHKVDGGYVRGEPVHEPKTREEYRRIAERNLAKLYEAMRGTR